MQLSIWVIRGLRAGILFKTEFSNFKKRTYVTKSTEIDTNFAGITWDIQYFSNTFLLFFPLFVLFVLLTTCNLLRYIDTDELIYLVLTVLKITMK